MYFGHVPDRYGTRRTQIDSAALKQTVMMLTNGSMNQTRFSNSGNDLATCWSGFGSGELFRGLRQPWILYHRGKNRLFVAQKHINIFVLHYKDVEIMKVTG